MGSAIAKNILNKHENFNVQESIGKGVRVAAIPRETVNDADIIISCLYDDKSCFKTAHGENGYLAGMKKDAIHINTTTITPKAAMELQKLHEQYNAHYIAALIIGRREVARAGKLSSFLGENRQAIDRVRPIIDFYSGGSIAIVGDEPSQANVIKLTGSILSYEERIRNRNYEAPIEGVYGVNGGLKDINAILNTGHETDVQLSFCQIVKEQYLSIINHDLKDKD
ncbi:hypothetical protein I4U23_001812 [Adineta vaga]|nr:hypothetical protein I4U23_001812 [Adineta vaga]